LSHKDTLDSYLRLFVKEEAFCFKAPTVERPVTSASQAIRFRPRRRRDNVYFEAERDPRERRLKVVI